VVECQDERSQHKKPFARDGAHEAKVIRRQQKRDSEIAQNRKSAGRHGRSLRAHPHLQLFRQGRVTDHRINLTLYKLADIMQGKIDELLAALAQEHQPNSSRRKSSETTRECAAGARRRRRGAPRPSKRRAHTGVDARIGWRVRARAAIAFILDFLIRFGLATAGC